MAKKANIQKLKEDTLFNNGSDKTIFPVTVGDAVVTEYENQKTTVDPALKKIYDTKCGWFDTRVDDNNAYHLLGFASKRTYEAWRSSGDSKYVLIDIITGEHFVDPEDPTPPDPPIPTNDPHLDSPVDYTLDSYNTVYTNSYPILLKGQHLTKPITIQNADDNRKQKTFMFKIFGENNSPTTCLKLTYSDLQKICGDSGLKVEISMNPEVAAASYDAEVYGKILIYNDLGEGEEKDFEDRVIRGMGYSTPKFAFPDYEDNALHDIYLSNEPLSENTKKIRLQGINITGNTTVTTPSNGHLYLSAGEYLDTSTNNTVITLDENTVNSGVDVFVTCNRYVDNEVESVPIQSEHAYITFSNTPNSSAYATVGLYYTYVTPDYPVLHLSDTLLSADYTELNPHAPYYELQMYGTNLTEDVVITAKYRPSSDLRPVRFLLSYAKYGTVNDWTTPVSNQDLVITKAEMNASSSSSPIVLRISFNPETFESIEPFSDGFCEIRSGEIEETVTIEYTRDSASTVEYGLEHSANPLLVDAMLRLLKERYKITSPDRNLTKDMCALIDNLPDRFMHSVGASLLNSVRFTELTELGVFENLRKVGNYAFANCVDLTTVVIPSNVYELGEYCFAGCPSLSSVTFENTVLNPVHIREIPQHAFEKCISLTSITIPGDVSIAPRAFVESGITSIIIEQQTDNTTPYVFDNESLTGCPNLTTIDIAGKVAIARNAFINEEGPSDAITDVYFRDETSIAILPAGGMGTIPQIFATGTEVTLHVPESMITAYENSNWVRMPQVTINLVAIEG